MNTNTFYSALVMPVLHIPTEVRFNWCCFPYVHFCELYLSCVYCCILCVFVVSYMYLLYLVCICRILRVFAVSYMYLLYLVCICCILCVFVVSYMYLLYLVCICCILCVFAVSYMYLLYLVCICCILCVFAVSYMYLLSSYVCLLYYVCIAALTLDAGLLARSQYPEGPATGHLDTGFPRFPCVYKRMLRWFPSFQVATTCLSCSPPDLNFLVTFYSHLCKCKITTATG
jgi:hypothetical protein